MVHLDLVLDAIVQLKVVVLQRGGAPRGQPCVRARAVEQQTGTDGPKEDAEGAHGYDGHQDRIQGVEPAFFFVQLRGSWRVSREQCVVPIRSKVICSGMGTYYPGIIFFFHLESFLTWSCEGLTRSYDGSWQGSLTHVQNYYEATKCQVKLPNSVLHLRLC